MNDITGKSGNPLTYQEVKELFNIKKLKNGRKGSK